MRLPTAAESEIELYQRQPFVQVALRDVGLGLIGARLRIENFEVRRVAVVVSLVRQADRVERSTLVKLQLDGSQPRLVIGDDVVRDFFERAMDRLQIRDGDVLLLRLREVNLRLDLAAVEDRRKQLRDDRKETERPVEDAVNGRQRRRRRLVRILAVDDAPAIAADAPSVRDG